MDQLLNVLLAIDKAHNILMCFTLYTRLMCVKPALYAQLSTMFGYPFHKFQYLCQRYNYISA